MLLHDLFPIMEADDHVAELPDAKPGLGRCTTVSNNSLLAHFKRPLITSPAEEPHNADESLRILSKRGLKFKPMIDLKPQSIEFFVKSHPKGAFYVGLPGHAVSVIDGELYDAERKGLDNRQVKIAAEVTV